MDQLVEQLKQVIRELSEEIKTLRDENESLWFMLEEMRESDKAAKLQLDKMDEDMMIEYLLKTDPVGEA